MKKKNNIGKDILSKIFNLKKLDVCEKTLFNSEYQHFYFQTDFFFSEEKEGLDVIKKCCEVFNENHFKVILPKYSIFGNIKDTITYEIPCSIDTDGYVDQAFMAEDEKDIYRYDYVFIVGSSLKWAIIEYPFIDVSILSIHKDADIKEMDFLTKYLYNDVIDFVSHSGSDIVNEIGSEETKIFIKNYSK